MLMVRCLVATYLLLAATCVPVVAQTCSSQFEVPDRTYYQLAQAFPGYPDLANAFVWLDDINSRLFGGYRPFDVFVIVGKNYPPFSASAGRLNRNDFDTIRGYKSANNRFTKWSIEPKKLGPGDFIVGQKRYLLTVVEVRNAYLAQNDSITVKVCTG
jgi:hypothetical protein